MGLAACAADPKIMLSDDGKEVTPVKAAGGQPGRGARVESARKRAEEAGARKREQKVAEEHESRLHADDAERLELHEPFGGGGMGGGGGGDEAGALAVAVGTIVSG